MGFYDATCPKCKKRFGWRGSMADKPACPKCRYLDPPDPEVEERIRKLMEKMLNDDDDQSG